MIEEVTILTVCATPLIALTVEVSFTFVLLIKELRKKLRARWEQGLFSDKIRDRGSTEDTQEEWITRWNTILEVIGLPVSTKEGTASL